MTNDALEGGLRLHTFIGLLPSIDDHQLAEAIHATKEGGEEPNCLTHRCGLALQRFKADIQKITVECQQQQLQKQGSGLHPASSKSSR